MPLQSFFETFGGEASASAHRRNKNNNNATTTTTSSSSTSARAPLYLFSSDFYLQNPLLLENMTAAFDAVRRIRGVEMEQVRFCVDIAHAQVAVAVCDK